MLRNIWNVIKKDYSRATIIVLGILLILVVFKFKPWQNAEKNGRLIDWDVTSYYGYLPAKFIHNDLSLEFIETDSVNYEASHQFWPESAENGGKVIKTTMGMSILYSPFFFLAKNHSKYINGNVGNGFSETYEFYLTLSNLFFTLLGLMIIRKVLRHYYSDKITATVLVLGYLGTNLFYYITVEPLMSHAYSFCLVSLFLWLTLKWYQFQSYKWSIFVGIIAGLIVLIRPVNIFILLFFVFYNVEKWQDISLKINFFIKEIPLLLVISLSAIVVFIPQLIYWKTMTDHYFFNSYVGEHFFFNNPHIFEGLFSYRKGWLLYTPLMIFGLIGLFFNNSKIKIGSFLISILSIIVTYSWWNWWYGGGFGSRPMIDFYPIYLLSLAGLLTHIKPIKLKYGLVTIMSLLMFFNLFQTMQKKSDAIHWENMTAEAYWYNFLKLKPQPGLPELFKEPNFKNAKKGVDE